MKKILLTGGTGFIGKNIIPLLENKSDIKVYIPYNSTHSDLKGEGINYFKCDLLDNDSLNSVMQDIKPTHLLHLAWKMEASNYNRQSNFDWLNSSIKLMELFSKNGGKRVVIAGSGVEYNWDYGLCNEDSTPLSYENLYGGTKNILRQYAELFCQSNEISFAWSRIFFAYGPYEYLPRLVPYIITQLLKGEEAEIRSGELYRDYIYAKDLAGALLELLFSNLNGSVNIGTGDPVKLGDFGAKVAEIIGRQDLLKINNQEVLKRKTVICDHYKLYNELGFRPKYTIEQGIKETVEWWKDKLKYEK